MNLIDILIINYLLHILNIKNKINLTSDAEKTISNYRMTKKSKSCVSCSEFESATPVVKTRKQILCLSISTYAYITVCLRQNKTLVIRYEVSSERVITLTIDLEALF